MRRGDNMRCARFVEVHAHRKRPCQIQLFAGDIAHKFDSSLPREWASYVTRHAMMELSFEGVLGREKL